MVGFGTRGQVKVQAVTTGADTTGFENEAYAAFRRVEEGAAMMQLRVSRAVSISRSMLRDTVTLSDNFNQLFGTTIDTQFIVLGLSAEAQLRSLYAALATAAATPLGWETIPLIMNAFVQVTSFMVYLKNLQDYTNARLEDKQDEAFERLLGRVS